MARLARHANVSPSQVEDGVLEETGFVALLTEVEKLRGEEREFLVELVSGLSKAIVESSNAVIRQIAKIPAVRV